MPRLSKSRGLTPFASVPHINWTLMLLLVMLCAVGMMVLYSAGRVSCAVPAECIGQFGGWRPWALPQLSRMIAGFAILVAVALVDIKFWVASAYWIYGASIIALVLVSVAGQAGMGAQRWLSLGFISFQPSEFAKIGLVLALARYFAALGVNEVKSIKYLIPAMVLAGLPVLLVLPQPDLGTAMMLVFVAAAIFFAVGVKTKYFVVIAVAAMVSLPIVWTYGLRDYQRQRVVIFLNPENDMLGSGYHIAQSKITIGSGGMTGKGYLKGSQSHLNFLPEKQTDFAFTMFAEEFGFMGAMFFFVLVFGIMWQCIKVAYLSRSQFGKLLAFGVGANFFVYFFINTSMVMGLLPVVGVPSPLISYGGTSVLAILFGFGLVQNCNVHRDELISAKSSYL